MTTPFFIPICLKTVSNLNIAKFAILSVQQKLLRVMEQNLALCRADTKIWIFGSVSTGHNIGHHWRCNQMKFVFIKGAVDDYTFFIPIGLKTVSNLNIAKFAILSVQQKLLRVMEQNLALCRADTKIWLFGSVSTGHNIGHHWRCNQMKFVFIKGAVDDYTFFYSDLP